MCCHFVLNDGLVAQAFDLNIFMGNAKRLFTNSRPTWAALRDPHLSIGPGMKLSGRTLAQYEKSSVPSILYPQMKVTQPRFTGVAL